MRRPTAGMEEEYGSVMPSASMQDAMVFAVYIPPHAPGRRVGTMDL